MPHSPALPHRTEQKGVSTLELFFDLVFVLAIAQVTLLMSRHATWEGLGEGVVVLGLLWWGWVGYSWLTSVVNPEHISVRLPLFGAMSGFAIAAMAVPRAFETTGAVFVCAYALVSFGQVVLMYVAGHDHPPMRRSTGGLAVGAAISSTLLAMGLGFGEWQLELWIAGLLVYVAAPLVFGSEGWLLTPTHFTERHSLIVIVALGESIIAVGAGAAHPERLGEIAVVFAGTLIAFCLWWVYFDVLSIVAEHRLEQAEPGRVQNELARDAYSYLHFPMIAGIVLGALGLKKAVAHVDEPLKLFGAVALLGGFALFLLGLAAFGRRATGRMAWDSVGLAVLSLLALAVATGPDALVVVLLVALAAVLLVVYKAVRFGEGRLRVRRKAHMLSDESDSDDAIDVGTEN